MIVYDLTVSKSGKIYCVNSAQFVSIIGYGALEYEAMADFFSKLHVTLNKLIKSGQPIPKSKNENIKTAKIKNTGTFTLPLPIELTIKLHSLMMDKGIDRPTLSRLLALTSKEVPSHHWELKKTIKLKPTALPKYKNVQRLLDVKHDSTINEFTEAFRVLDNIIDIKLVEKK